MKFSKMDKVDALIVVGSLVLKFGASILDRIEDNREIKKDLNELVENARKKKK